LSRMTPLELPCRPDVQASFEAVMKDREPLILLGAVAAGERVWRKFRVGSLLDRGPLTLRQREIVIDRTTARAAGEAVVLLDDPLTRDYASTTSIGFCS
jgi:hypothetical protein